MLKIAMLAGVIATMTMTTNSSINSLVKNGKELDSQIIVEVNRDKDSLTEEGIANTQKAVLNNIRTYATSNVRLLYSYKNVLNAFAISINKDDIELVKQVPGVKSVTLNELHWKTETAEDGAVALSSGGVQGEYGGTENISAETMYKPENTNDGEGTTIAVLDNEFYLKGAVKDDGGNITPAWSHEVFTALDDDVAVKHTERPAGYSKTIAALNLKTSAKLGEEGSLYFNSKVPFYYDYGGEIVNYSDDPVMDFDVTCDLSYHGSHVASIAAANAPEYKGIAPKAQLFCMKVFTSFKASKFDKLLGLSSYSGAYDLPIMNALEDCMTLKVDGINMSLGSNLDDFDKDSATRKVLRKLANMGIMTSISAGNSGKTSFSTVGAYGNWTKEMAETGILSGYANEAETMTIAAGQPTQIFYENGFDLDGANVAFADQIVNTEGWDQEYEVEYKMEDIFDDGTKTYSKEVGWVYVPGFGRSSDYQGLDVNGKIAVVNRGSTNFSDKYTVAVNKGAIALVIINNDPTASDFNFRCSFGDDFSPTMPCALVLYKDKEKFSEEKAGTIKLIRKKLIDNPDERTISSFSSDGATYDLDLKPEITAPGENIRGAVPPQKQEDRVEERRYGVYEYLSGTSMSAPNYAGCQSLLLSKVAAPYYKNGKTPSSTTLNTVIYPYRDTIDMRLMSTADPMIDAKENGENGEKSTTSPRKQGAGMVNLKDAYNTDVYLEGMDLEGNPIGKSKICLRNNEQINKGVIRLSFIGHNESNVKKTYNASISVMRPATNKTQDIVTKEYNDKGEVEKIQYFPGHSYYMWDVDPVTHQQIVSKIESEGTAKHNDVYKVSREISYYASEEDLRNGVQTTIAIGRYYNAGDENNVIWESLPTYEYQSVYDVEIAQVNLGTVELEPGDTVVELADYSLTQEARDEIAELYEYGCYIEGYLTLDNVEADGIDLSMPYMGYYSAQYKEGGSYEDCPVTEPFSFEKSDDTVYPSDLVNDLAKTLLGKDKHDMGSLWVAGYVEQGKQVNVDEICKNDNNFANLSGFHSVGTDPVSGKLYDDVKNNIYVGNANGTNTMIVQKFMLRSVADNYFTITNKVTGKEVYRSSMEDILYGEQGGKYPLYKSHVDENYLGAGYVCHRAYAVIPLYEPTTGVAFESGEYEIKFNYLLAATGNWVNESYNIHVDSDAPEVSSVTTSGDKVVFNIKENNLVRAQVGERVAEFVQTSATTASITLDREDVINEIKANYNKAEGSGRLYIKLTDKAFGTMGVIIRFDPIEDEDTGKVTDYNLSNYVMAQYSGFEYDYDFIDNGDSVKFIKNKAGTTIETEVSIDAFILISRGPVQYATSGGCGGNIIATSTTLSAIAILSFVALLISKKKRKLGGKF